MPIYEYRCQSCDHKFEMLRNIRDNDNDVECPECHERQAERRISLSSLGEFLRSLAGTGCNSSGSGFR
jgi:putative FmdB family regulatory protein